MARAVSILGLVTLCWLAAGATEACTLGVVRNPGESWARAYDRYHREAQDRYWAEADMVFVGEVVGLVRGEGRLEVSVQPRTSFKGDAGAELITYDLDGVEVSCDRAQFPDFSKAGLFYARREDGRVVVRGMLSPDHIRDEALRTRTISQLEPAEITDLEMETPQRVWRGRLLAGLLAVCTFCVGLVVGRWWKARKLARL